MWFTVLLLAGLQINSLPDPGTKPLTLFFIRTDCPVSNRYAPVMEHLYEAFHDKGIDFRLVYVERDLTPAQMEAHRREYGYTIPALADPDRRYVQLAHARMTPEAAVFVQGKLIYRGRIDDRYLDYGKTRPEPSRHDLEDVLTEIVAGKTLRPRETKGFGCAISDLP
jgi:hypothetical protein